MTLVLNDATLPAGIELDLDQARAELIDARRGQRHKDTPVARARVAACVAYLDALLDMWNDTAPARRR